MFNQKSNLLYQAGFTLVEIVLTLAIISTVALISMPIYWQLKPANDLDTTLSLVVHNLRRAQTLAMGVEHDSTWSATLEPGTMTLYATDTNGNRLVNYDEVFPLPAAITFTGQSTFVFAKLTGKPVTAGTIVLTNPHNNVSKTITINQVGVASY